MLQTQPNPRPRRRPSTTHADRRFRRYRTEKEQAVRMPEVVENETLTQLKDAWRRFNYDPGIEKTIQHNYPKAVKAIADLEYTAEDVRNFSIVLAEFQGEKNFFLKAGLFLSALINNCQDNEFIVYTYHLKTQLNAIGFLNEKNITVKGDTGVGTGSDMKGGSIMIEGDTDSMLGFCMGSGTIVVKGNAGYIVGDAMKGGTIIIEGNAGISIGREMKGGEIHVNGDRGYLGIHIKGGNIYHRGKLIVKNGVELGEN